MIKRKGDYFENMEISFWHIVHGIVHHGYVSIMCGRVI